MDFPGSSVVKKKKKKKSTCQAGDSGSIPGWENALLKEMATHSGIIAWKISWTEEPGKTYGCKESDVT